jgi:small GTP-binding protein
MHIIAETNKDDLQFDLSFSGEKVMQAMNVTDKVSVKVVLLGNSGVGKTSIVYRWISTGTSPRPDPTVGVNHQRKSATVEDRDVDVYLWDTAGQEQYQALTPLYVHSSSCALIVAAIDDAQSFEAIPKWIDVLQQSCSRPPPLILLVNKMDLASEAVATITDIELTYKTDFHSIFFVSAVTAEGVDAAYNEAVLVAFRFQINTKHPSPRVLADVEITHNPECC